LFIFLGMISDLCLKNRGANKSDSHCHKGNISSGILDIFLSILSAIFTRCSHGNELS
jgi:hypothetical protein